MKSTVIVCFQLLQISFGHKLVFVLVIVCIVVYSLPAQNINLDNGNVVPPCEPELSRCSYFCQYHVFLTLQLKCKFYF